jgi:hypothetical protein
MRMRNGKKPPIDSGGVHRRIEKMSFTEQHQYEVEKDIKRGANAPRKGKPRSWQQAKAIEENIKRRSRG